jgi:hypothetical protein
MTYELSVFDELVFGSLSPFYSKGNNREKHLYFLNENFGNCEQYSIFQFKNEKDELVLQKKTVLFCIHPSAKKFYSDQLKLFQETDFDHIDKRILSMLKLENLSIKSILHQRQLKKMSLGVVQNTQWDNLCAADLKYYFYCGLLKQEKEKLIDKIKNKIHTTNSKEEIEQYIHKHQQSIIAMCVKLMNQFDFEKNCFEYKIKESYSDHDIINLIYHYLEKILRFIESNYLRFIDKNISIPYKSKLLEEYELESKSAAVNSAILNSDLNSEIKSIVLTPLFRLNQFNIKDRISYQELIYYNTYITELYNNMKLDHVISESLIIRILFQVNYNSLSLLEYLQKQIMFTLRDLGDRNLQLDYLYKTLKETNQKNICSQLAFNPSELSLKVLLSGWIEEEIQYINNIQINLKTEKTLFQNQSEKNKILSELNVSELALLFRLLNEAQAFPHENKSEYIEFIADSFCTKRAESISISSLRTKYYSPDELTIKGLNSKMHEMLNILKDI